MTKAGRVPVERFRGVDIANRESAIWPMRLRLKGMSVSPIGRPEPRPAVARITQQPLNLVPERDRRLIPIMLVAENAYARGVELEETSR